MAPIWRLFGAYWAGKRRGYREMALKLYLLSRSWRCLSRWAGHIRLCACGPTVYDRAHVDNAGHGGGGSAASGLRHLYPKVTLVRNMTDVDDKIIARSSKWGDHCRAPAVPTSLSGGYGADRLPAAHHRTKATEHIPHMIAMMGGDDQAGL